MTEPIKLVLEDDQPDVNAIMVRIRTSELALMIKELGPPPPPYVEWSALITLAAILIARSCGRDPTAENFDTIGTEIFRTVRDEILPRLVRQGNL